MGHELSVYAVTAPDPDCTVLGEAGDVSIRVDPDRIKRAEIMTKIAFGDLQLTKVSSGQTFTLEPVGIFDGDTAPIVVVRSSSPIDPVGDVSRYFAISDPSQVLLPGHELRTPRGVDARRPRPLRQSYLAMGTWVSTPFGPRPVEGLVPGDIVNTLDSGPRPIRWVGSMSLRTRTLEINPRLRPVRIAAGALGPGLPSRDLVLAPQQLVLVHGLEGVCGVDEVLVPVEDLTHLQGVERIIPRGGLRGCHVLLDAHQILVADGVAVESFYPDDTAALAFGATALRRMRDVVGSDSRDYGPRVRSTVDAVEVGDPRDAVTDPMQILPLLTGPVAGQIA